MTKQYTVGGRVFAKQADLDAEVKRCLNAHPFNVVFHDDFLAAVVNELHPDVIAAGQHTKGEFEYIDYMEQMRRDYDTADRYRGGKLLLTRFYPLDEWRDVTVYPWRKAEKPEKNLKVALREKIAPHLPKPQQWSQCAVIGCKARGRGLEYQHVSPTFDDIANDCLALMSKEEISAQFGYNKFVPGRDHLVYCIPDDHPATHRLFDLHADNQWEWLCAFHHRNVGANEQHQIGLAW